MFSIFCTDIIENWTPHGTAPLCLKSLVQRLGCWKKFFQRETILGLRREDYVGLYGELYFMESALREGAEAASLVNAWQAPLGTNQDFLFGPVAVEIKTITSNEANRVRVTNTRQLDSSGLTALFLVRFAFDFRRDSGNTLLQLIASLRTAFANAPDTLLTFNDRLLQAGFVDGQTQEFAKWGFTPRLFDAFNVADDFPRILESVLPLGISDVSYSLDLAASRAFHIEQHEFWTLIASCHA